MINFMNSIMDIHSKGEYPACDLSNFAEHEFYIDDVKCLSMEGFLQSLKFRSIKKAKASLFTIRKRSEEFYKAHFCSTEMENHKNSVLEREANKPLF